MNQFVVIPTMSETSTLDAKVQARFGTKCFQLPLGQWLVAYDGTSKQLSDELGISEGEVGVTALVLGISGYFGRANKDIWEWMSVNASS